ncbi:MAG: LLM class F420-dependent oxidoreductase [Candidatus Rokuibacteriota bacterium]|nr:MAG: LLM class F420-dependent oxidoreductase [Candidatus Rokubacteria bacterium]
MKVGLEVLLAENHWLRRAPRYAEIRDLALRAEAMGFDSLWLYDHLLYRDAEGRPHGIWECWTMLSALAEATEHAEIGSLVACTAFRNPALLAKMAATLDEVSGGRFTLGLGAGWNAAEFVAFGLPFDHRVTRFEEALQIITALVREGQVAFQGTYHSTPGCEILPRGPRPGGQPILIGGFGPRMLRLVARYADSWNGGYVAAPRDLDQLRAALADACTEVGRDPATLAITAELKVAYPDLAPPPPLFGDRYATGSADEMAATLSSFAEAGFTHLMCTCIPSTPQGLERLSASLRAYRTTGTRDRPASAAAET